MQLKPYKNMLLVVFFYDTIHVLSKEIVERKEYAMTICELFARGNDLLLRVPVRGRPTFQRHEIMKIAEARRLVPQINKQLAPNQDPAVQAIKAAVLEAVGISNAHQQSLYQLDNSLLFAIARQRVSVKLPIVLEHIGLPINPDLRYSLSVANREDETLYDNDKKIHSTANAVEDAVEHDCYYYYRNNDKDVIQPKRSFVNRIMRRLCPKAS